ncbi:TAFII28-domain-containing protein [Lentinula aciculospora]|uniref:Transcription initiation factor TFIID subunit 11 n=1 Tax=Lentinula aciculospora TaxID=153920 RepID=A0A9W9A3T0_9AGAR|nr:TAFII28-domain-containing protein [Lentinula aciculospora]
MSAPQVPDAPYAFTSPSPEPVAPPAVASHAGPGRPRGSGAKRGRKPRGAVLAGVASPRVTTTEIAATTSPAFPSSTYTPRVHWDLANTALTSSFGASGSSSVLPPTGISRPGSNLTTGISAYGQNLQTSSISTLGSATTAAGTPYNLSNLFRLSEGINSSGTGSGAGIASYPRAAGLGGGDDEGEGDDEILPAMADDDYSAQLSWQSQSKDNLKVLMENFSPDQYDRFEAYRRHALPKQAVRKVIQQVTGQQASQPVAQIVAGFAKVFVGEMVEKARQVQARRGDTGPLSPDHLREAYRMYQQETGNVGAAKPVRAKKLFVR